MALSYGFVLHIGVTSLCIFSLDSYQSYKNFHVLLCTGYEIKSMIHMSFERKNELFVLFSFVISSTKFSLNIDYFVGFIMPLFGPRVYHQTAVNVIDSMQYPQINKYANICLHNYM